VVSPSTLAIESTDEGRVLTVGAEGGAWALESSTDLGTWNELAQGVAAERLVVDASFAYSFFRVRSLTTAAGE
jgi:hypothetical protein